MTVGMVLAALAFIAAALVQIQINKTLPTFPSASETQVKVVNMDSSPWEVTINSETPFLTEGFQATEEYMTYENSIEVFLNTTAVNKTMPLTKGSRQTLLITPNPNNMYLIDDTLAKPEQGNNEVRFINGMSAMLNVTGSKADFGSISPTAASNYSLIPQGMATFTIVDTTGKTCDFYTQFGFGSSYTFLIPSTLTWADCSTSIVAIQDIKPNTVHMAWQIPQYIILTLGEVVYSVTGLEFSYSQAPSNMKSVLQAGWLFTVAVGNFIVLIVAEAAQLPEQWMEYVLFASLLLVVSVVFAVMAYFYTYIDPAQIEAQCMDENDKDKKDFPMDKRDSIKQISDDIKQTKI